MIRIKNAIYVLFVIVILYMENICTNIYYMSGGVKGGESVVLCVLLLIFIIYDLFMNVFFI